jgi:hypothetical protein
VRNTFLLVLVGSAIAAVILLDRWSTARRSASRPQHLDAAIAEFNNRASNHPLGRRQPPLSAEEIIAAIEARETTHLVDEVEYHIAAQLTEIASTRELPPRARLRSLHVWQPSANHYMDVWWVQLLMTDSKGRPHFIPIRQSLPHEYRELSPTDLAWGPASADGLQAACYLVPARSQYGMGDTVARRVAIRNVGRRPIEFEMPALRDDERLTAQTSDGQSIAVSSKQDGSVPRVQIRLVPQDCQILYHALPIKFASHAQSSDHECIEAISQPGQTCLLSWEIEVAVHNVGPITLQTGEVELALCDRSAAQDAQHTPRGVSPLPNDELIGQLVSANIYPEASERLVAGFRTVRGSTSSFAVDIPLNSQAVRTAALIELIRHALRTKSAGDMPMIRIRTDENGRPNPETWTLLTPSGDE